MQLAQGQICSNELEHVTVMYRNYTYGTGSACGAAKQTGDSSRSKLAKYMH